MTPMNALPPVPALAIDAIINQKNTGIKCVYVAIGQKASSIANVVRKLEENGALAHTIIVAATIPATTSAWVIVPSRTSERPGWFARR